MPGKKIMLYVGIATIACQCLISFGGAWSRDPSSISQRWGAESSHSGPQLASYNANVPAYIRQSQVCFIDYTQGKSEDGRHLFLECQMKNLNNGKITVIRHLKVPMAKVGTNGYVDTDTLKHLISEYYQSGADSTAEFATEEI